MTKAAEYKDFIASIRSGLGYWKSYSLLQFTSSLVRLMKLDNVQGKELASKLGVSAAQVSKVLGGQENVTVETMAKFADALDAVVHIHVAKRGVQVQWREAPLEKIAMPRTTTSAYPPTDSLLDFMTSDAYVRRAKLRGQVDDAPCLKEAYG